MCINGKFVYTTKQEPLKAGHAKTEEYADNARRLGGRLFAKCLEESVGINDSAPTSQIQSLRVCYP